MYLGANYPFIFLPRTMGPCHFLIRFPYIWRKTMKKIEANVIAAWIPNALAGPRRVTQSI